MDMLTFCSNVSNEMISTEKQKQNRKLDRIDGLRCWPRVLPITSNVAFSAFVNDRMNVLDFGIKLI